MLAAATSDPAASWVSAAEARTNTAKNKKYPMTNGGAAASKNACSVGATNAPPYISASPMPKTSTKPPAMIAPHSAALPGFADPRSTVPIEGSRSPQAATASTSAAAEPRGSGSYGTSESTSTSGELTTAPPRSKMIGMTSAKPSVQRLVRLAASRPCASK